MLRKVPDLKVDNRDIREFTPKEVEKIYRHLGVAGDYLKNNTKCGHGFVGNGRLVL